MKRSIICFSIFIFIFPATVLAQFDRAVPKYSPTADGIISDSEKMGQLAIPMVWPVETGAIPLEGSGSSEENLSAIWYVSWDDTNLNIAAIVKDDTPLYQLDSNGGNSAYNAQDVIQPCFNPFNNWDHFFEDGIPDDVDPGDSVAAIYDIVVETSDEFGPDIYRHGPKLDPDEYESITVAGTINEDESGYTLETTIPWAAAMDDAAPDYAPTVGDQHGLSFILLSFATEGGAANATLYTDFGEGINTIGDPTSWNSITLIGATAQAGDFDANGSLDINDIDLLHAEILAGTNNESYDLTADQLVNGDDYHQWVTGLKNTWIGDADLDGEFNSSDFVTVFVAGQFEDSISLNSTWATGDWNADGEFNSSDFVSAFSDGGFEKGPRAAVAIPEPSSFLLLLTSLLAFFAMRRCK
ncbi:MAG: PEP-CTERM sorting domain-containing protein [Planctomycetaceae bacterium]|nr:PEP-CTERM sorting domain-containing protein [Planctomycetaceae bacterium]